ncbi:nephrocystin-4-like isoform X3 [Mytilus californianus]|uniref:nephrocystin-4-like isoform X3 n=1 Tax=Mytilus californianus TaxID=6549 RepID=UPI0022451A55|nr:nephrocystin-4-like isoform X3 [Mytilus californianus]
MKYLTLHRSLPQRHNFLWKQHDPTVDKHADCDNIPIVISLKQIHGLTPPYQIKLDVGKQPEYQVRVSLYDATYKNFLGRQWLGPLHTAQGGGENKPKLKYNQNVYFHTSINSIGVMAIVEVISLMMDQNGNMKYNPCGWTIVRIFKTDEELPDSSRSSTVPVQKIQMYYGSPRALYFMEEPLEENNLLKPIPDCVLQCTIATHKAMLYAMSVMPENVIVGNNDVIPGLQDGNTPGKDRMKKAKLHRQVIATIEALNIHLPPSVEKFEDELCALLSEDRRHRENRQTGTNVSIVERRLLIGVHNGWCYLSKPELHHLDVWSEGNKVLKPQASPSMRRSQKYMSTSVRSLNGAVSQHGQGTMLVLKNRLEICELLEDPMLSLVFTLEYVIGEPISQEERKMYSSLSRGNSRIVALRWCAWNPFLHPNQENISISLMGGAVPNPNDDLTYKLPDTKMQDADAGKHAGGSINFYWKCSMDGQSLQVPMGAPHFLPGSMPSVRSDDGSEALPSPDSSKRPPSGRVKEVKERKGGGRHTSWSSDTTKGSHLGESFAGPHSLQVPQIQMPQTYYPQGYQPQMPQMPPMYGMAPHTYMPMMQGPAYDISHRQPSIPPPHPEISEQVFRPTHTPIMMPLPQPDRAQGLSRAAYARLYSAGFHPILDRNKEPPEVIDPNVPVQIDLVKEEQDTLQCNEIIFQFLAFSKYGSDIQEKNKHAGTVFFTFQFYRCPQVTTERLLLAKPQNDLSSDPLSMPFILQRLEKDGALSNGPPGLEVKYYMDPMSMKLGEVSLLLSHLYRQRLHIDVWDGDSLMRIGSASVPLMYLCRSGHEAVQSTFELDVVMMEYDDPNLIAGTQSQGAQPLGIQSMMKGKLHFRMANVGHYSDPKANLMVSSKSTKVISNTAGNIAYPGGSLNTNYTGITPKKKVARAHHITESNREVAALLHSHQDQVIPERDNNREGDSEKLRKLSRMEAVRQKEGIDNKFNTVMSYKTEKQERMRDFKTLEIYRMQSKKDGILNMLSQAITTDHVINPAFGSTEFFEFVLKNPYNVQQTFTVEFDDKYLHVITDAREWRYFKQLNGLQSPLEEGMFTKQSKSQFAEIFLRPKETVYIPFKYLSFKADHTVHPQGPVDPFKKSEKKIEKSEDSLKESLIRVHFNGEDGKSVSIMSLKVQPIPHVIDQTFRFHSPEQTFLKRSIRIPMDSLPGVPVGGRGLNQLFVRCSDPNIITECKATQPGEPLDVYLKVAMGASPQIKRFYIAIFTDAFMSKPIQVWQVYAHSLQRVDVSCVEGQTSRFSLLLRGTQSSRLVRCFSSNDQEMQLYPNEQFMLAAGAVHELSVAVRPLNEGIKIFHLNVVDIEYHQLIRNWLICVTCRSPMISRVFDLSLPVGGGKGSSKRITYTNPYPHKKTFILLTNEPELLQFKETRIEVEGGAEHTIGLRFAPVMKTGASEVMVFINDEDDKNEETFKINATYS